MNISDRSEVIPLWSDGAPGTEDWNQQEQERLVPPPISFRTIRNVTQPTLTAFLPHSAVASGRAVIICPGGAFHSLAMDHEGIEVARRLSVRGIAAFVLKYRLLQTEAGDEDFERQFQENVSDRNRLREITERIGPLAVADGQQAMKVVRQRAAEWSILPDRIGMMGFSAGGRVTIGVALEHDEESCPNFAAAIYGALWGDITVPDDAPPLFIALAERGELTTAAQIKQAFEKRVGHEVDETTIHRLLKRLKWRKLVPRPFHPQADKEEQEFFEQHFATLVEEALQSSFQKGIIERKLVLWHVHRRACERQTARGGGLWLQQGPVQLPVCHGSWMQ